MNSQPVPRPDRHVVVISLDGFPAYMWPEPDLPIPNLRRLAAAGSGAAAMTETTPASTWSSHTSMITSRRPRTHGVLYLGQLIRQSDRRSPIVEQWADKDGFVLAPTLYDVAHAAGLTTAESDWVAITNAKTITWPFPEIPSVKGKVEREMIAAGVLTEEQIGWMQHRPGRKSLVWHDEMWTKATCFILERHRPNLMLHHTLAIDSIHHNVGARTESSYLAIAYADRLVGDIVQAVERSGVMDRTTFIVMSDHGFRQVHRYVYLNVALKLAGYARSEGDQLVDCDAAVMSMGGIACVYLTEPARKAELMPKLIKLFAAIEGVARVFDAHEGPSIEMPTPAENPRMGDLIIVMKPDYEFQLSAAGDQVVVPVAGYRGTHGYLGTDAAMDGIFFAAGAEIKRGVQLPRVSSLDLAPTIARLLGLQLPGAEGRVIEEILKG